ncbi:hypothetical protein [Streptococcus gallolyticus]|uniref:hypothetical protein n=1 Tax=Streptococcus gallolyticus TaxID=315405 RepID=UPI002283A534|nr:hypothetical protein [Streptococcus gallolyticus]MCY7166137.1 hypothetical protein [Streptococcus gallolyticus subsp. gallolyticus]MCY7183235.1 hypothetical protein [Streptococcus gallolyticus subsp. gallolyticus]
MVNDENLIPITDRSSSEAREMGRKGGIASGKVRRQQADLRRAFQTLLRSEVNNEQMKQLLIQLGYDPTNEMALALVVLQKALNGDMKAFSQIQQILNQNAPTDKDD